MVSHIIVQIKNLHIFIHHLFVRKHFPETNLHLWRPFLLVKGLFMSCLEDCVCSYLCGVYKDFD